LVTSKSSVIRQEELKSGNISVGNSKRFGRFDDYFLPQEQWAFRRETFFQRSGLPSDPKELAGYLKARLNRAYDLFLQTAPGNSYASVDEDGWCLSVDTPEKPGKEADENLDRLKSWLGRHMRTTRLTDMLIEVDNDIRFTDHFLPRRRRRAKGIAKRSAPFSRLCLAMVATSGWEQWPI
jgi:hypothetical protein